MDENEIEEFDDVEDFVESICGDCSDPALRDAVGGAVRVIFDESVGDWVRKAGKVAAGVALAANLANAAPAQKANHSVPAKGKAVPAKVQKCSGTVRNAWNNPKYQAYEEQFLQEELARQQKLVDEGKRSRVDEQRALDTAQQRAIHAIACPAG